MRNRGDKIGLAWFGIVAIAISLVALCLTLFRVDPTTCDWMGVIVGALAVLVTTLIGWQIYTFIDINKKASELSQLTLQASLGIEKGLALSENAAAEIYSYLLLEKDPLGLAYNLLHHRICSLLHTSNFDDIEACNAIVKVMLEQIVDPSKIDMIQSCKERLLILLSQVRHSDKIVRYSELIERIARINVVPNESVRGL